jgi:hypothetical protein
MFVMNGIYKTLAAMCPTQLQELARQLEFNTDPWAVGARKLVAWEMRSDRHAAGLRNKIYSF